jgi:hypothetical protein
MSSQIILPPAMEEDTADTEAEDASEAV